MSTAPASAAGPAPAGGRIRVEDRGLVRVLTIENPGKRNAFDYGSLAALAAAVGDREVDGALVIHSPKPGLPLVSKLLIAYLPWVVGATMALSLACSGCQRTTRA